MATMATYKNRSAFVKSPWQFEIREHEISGPGPGQLLVEIAACAVCGTDFHTADRTAEDWQNFGHEVSGTVHAVGEGVTAFVPGDRVAMDSSVPCGKCEFCKPAPFGRGRPDLCVSCLTYWASETMGFGDWLLTPQESAVKVPDSVPLDVASMIEPMGVSIDLVETAQINKGDHVLVIGPGPLGLGAVCLAKLAGAGKIMLAGFSTSVARMKAGAALGAEELIEVDKTPLKDYDFGARRPDKILVTAPPPLLPQAIAIAANGATIAYIGIAFGPGAVIEFDADDFHFRKLQLRASFASPGTQALKAARLLETVPELGKELISHRFKLEDIAEVFKMARDDKECTVNKVVMVR
jgi:L-iditol 2-dehydrogenase